MKPLLALLIFSALSMRLIADEQQPASTGIQRLKEAAEKLDTSPPREVNGLPGEAISDYRKLIALARSVEPSQELVELVTAKPEYLKGYDQETGFSPLPEAAKFGNLKNVRLLVEKGAPVDVQDVAGRTALYYAVWWEHEKIVEFLLESGADPETRDKEGISPIAMASSVKGKKLLQKHVKKPRN